ncbi:MAG: ATPase domain-containing protein [Candidatus Diapherotrites archaeon]
MSFFGNATNGPKKDPSKKASIGVVIPPAELKEIAMNRTNVQVTPHKNAKISEVKAFQKEILSPSLAKSSTPTQNVLPTYIPGLDEMIEDNGFERGSTILITGGAGCGKTTICCQMLYNAIKDGEKVVYISLEEEVKKLKAHMKKNFGWDFSLYEKNNQATFIQMDPIDVARKIESQVAAQKGKLLIEMEDFDFPFKPDRIVLDSLSALSIAFENSESYRKFIRHLFKRFEETNSLVFMIGENEQNPRMYSHAGVEEYLVDGVVVLYNIKSGSQRITALEILKLRSSKHAKKIVPFNLTKTGIEVFPDQEIFEEPNS